MNKKVLVAKVISAFGIKGEVKIVVFLEDYKNILDDSDLEHPLYKKLYEDNKKILTVLQNMKLDDCKNTFSIESKGGRLSKKKNLKNQNVWKCI